MALVASLWGVGVGLILDSMSATFWNVLHLCAVAALTYLLDLCIWLSGKTEVACIWTAVFCANLCTPVYSYHHYSRPWSGHTWLLCCTSFLILNKSLCPVSVSVAISWYSHMSQLDEQPLTQALLLKAQTLSTIQPHNNNSWTNCLNRIGLQ